MSTRHGWIDPTDQLPGDTRPVLVTTRLAEVREAAYNHESHTWWAGSELVVVVGWQDMPHPSATAYAHPPRAGLNAVQLAQIQLLMRQFEEKYTGGYVHITFMNPSMSAGECHYRTAPNGPAEGVIEFDTAERPRGHLTGADRLLSSLEAVVIHGSSRLARKPTDA